MNSTKSISTDKINARQIFFILVLSVTVKLFMLPGLLANDAGHSMWLSVMLLFAFEMLLFTVIAIIFKRQKNNNIGRIFENAFGKTTGTILAKVIYLALGFYFFAKVLLLLLEQHYFLDDVIYRNFSVYALVLPFLVIAVYMASKGLRAVARISDLIFFPIAGGILLLLILSVTSLDFTKFFPVLESGTGIIKASVNNHIYFGDSVVLLMFLGGTTVDRANVTMSQSTKQSEIKKSLWGLVASFGCLLIFSVLFINIFSNLAPAQHSAIAHTTKYSMSLMFLGGISWIPLMLLHVGSIFYICILFYFGTRCLHALYPKADLSIYAIIKAFLILAFIMLFANKFFDMYDLYFMFRYVLLGIIVTTVLLLFFVSLKNNESVASLGGKR